MTQPPYGPPILVKKGHGCLWAFLIMVGLVLLFCLIMVVIMGYRLSM